MDYHLSSTAGVKFEVLEHCIGGILGVIKPSESDRIKRLDAITQFVSCLSNAHISGGAAVEPFGSFVSNLYTKWGDLDVSVQLHAASGISPTRTIKRNTLRRIMKALQRFGLTQHIQFIPNARVPLLIFESRTHNVSFDVSINNHLGIAKSKIVLWISQLDERFRDMVLLTKEWAKTQNINDPKTGTLNSYSLCLLVIFYFQIIKPPILPPLREIYHGNISDDITGWTSITEGQIEGVCAANIERFRSLNLRRRNQAPLAQLLSSFFNLYQDIQSWASDFALCTYTGRWERIINDARWRDKPHNLLIEDPFEQPENAARAVSARGVLEISNAFKDAFDKLNSDTVLAHRSSLLSVLTRPTIGSQVPHSITGRSRSSNLVGEPAVARRQAGSVMRAEGHSQPSSTQVQRIGIIRRVDGQSQPPSTQVQRIGIIRRGDEQSQPSSTQVQRIGIIRRGDEQSQPSSTQGQRGRIWRATGYSNR